MLHWLPDNSCNQLTSWNIEIKISVKVTQPFVHWKAIFTFSIKFWNLVIIPNNLGSICLKIEWRFLLKTRLLKGLYHAYFYVLESTIELKKNKVILYSKNDILERRIKRHLFIFIPIFKCIHFYGAKMCESADDNVLLFIMLLDHGFFAFTCF